MHANRCRLLPRPRVADGCNCSCQQHECQGYGCSREYRVAELGKASRRFFFWFLYGLFLGLGLRLGFLGLRFGNVGCRRGLCRQLGFLFDENGLAFVVYILVSSHDLAFARKSLECDKFLAAEVR